MKLLFALPLIATLLSCKKETIHRERELELSEFAAMFDRSRHYAIASYTDTSGHALAFDPVSEKDNKYVFEATFGDRNARVYNTTKETVCLFHWAAYAHPQGWIVFEAIDFHLTPTAYRLIDYNIEQGYFVIQHANTLLTLKQIPK